MGGFPIIAEAEGSEWKRPCQYIVCGFISLNRKLVGFWAVISGEYRKNRRP